MLIVRTVFDTVDYLKDEQTIAAYLTEALKENDPELMIKAIKDVARARGVNNIVKKMGVGRTSFYKSFSGKTKPSFETVYKALCALGLSITILPN